jgi:hypothetical protein
MRKLKLPLTTLLIFTAGFYSMAAAPGAAFSVPDKTIIIDKPKHSTKDELRLAQMKLFVSLTPGQYEKLKGKKMNFIELFSFKISQRRMKKMIKIYDYGDGPTTLQKISWLLKGLVLGPIALILGYIFLQDEERDLIKWVWFGFAGFAAIIAILLLM